MPAIWDGAGLIELVQRSAAAAQLQLEPAAAELLADTIGNDSSRLAGELEKLALYCGEKLLMWRLSKPWRDRRSRTPSPLEKPYSLVMWAAR